MNDQKLLASVALFRDLYDNNKDIYHIITEFIRSAINFHSKWSITSTECAHILSVTFGFDIPEAVIKSCLRNRLKKAGELTVENGVYTTTDRFQRNDKIYIEHSSLNQVYSEIIQSLISSINVRSVTPLNDDQTSKLVQSFNDYLLDDKNGGDYANDISYFILANQDKNGFKDKLNKIEEGVILYAGIRYSSNINDLGLWHSNLTIFLDTEILFSAVGFHGNLYKQIFDDFYKLVSEINSSKNKQERINLKYFEEIEKEVESFFYAAEKIVEEHKSPDPSKTAMMFIINGCKSKSDVVVKKNIFLGKLKSLRILKEDSIDYYLNHNLNIESTALIDNLKSEFNNNIDDQSLKNILKLFTKINVLRKGDNDCGIDRVGAIFLTANRLTQALSFNGLIKPNNKSIPFATDIDFMTERLWFKLNKGFGGDLSRPISFDIVTKAQIVLSSQINSLVSKNYKDLIIQHRNGTITNEDAAKISASLRLKPNCPEDITNDNLDIVFELLSSDIIEDALKENHILQIKCERGDKAIDEINKYKLRKKREITTPLKKVIKRQFTLFLIFIYFFIPIFFIKLILYIITSNDTNLGIASSVATVLGLVISILNYKKINNYLWKRSKICYKRYLKSELKSFYKEFSSI